MLIKKIVPVYSYNFLITIRITYEELFIKFDIEALFRHFHVYTDTHKKKTHNIVKSIDSSLRSESKITD
ncbi:hypothetical protein FWK35_00003052 [Aphis craccivora]|uniref:Uncharacterized protein n=1 Tax=Aphis craccivora TaxID=307492 RepID=A0A6G0YYB7_APHCR|nr:hypothetical protein FWK35_00003052 [Aphis craccivora]